MAQHIKFQPVHVVRASSNVMEQLAAMIRKNEIPLGEKLPAEKDLADQFGTSRATIREALSGLKAIGLIESHAGKGNFVTSSIDAIYDWDGLVHEIRTRTGFLEAIEARRAMEGEICYLAALRATQADLEAIEGALKVDSAMVSPDVFCDADHYFHLQLAKATSNNLFIRFIEEAFVQLTSPYWKILRSADPNDGVFQHYDDDHWEIFEAVKNGEPEVARCKMLRHLERVKEDFLRTFEEPEKAMEVMNGGKSVS